ncbi:imidazole glycerol phosphate synthase subunit HisH [uncultured Treponema sp.]|uniref:imidazole glycerol phosphate synthase subunit HisH n=1 Tax=uncultured Treponema sp. TaxID=162155 RepID=UPI0025FB0A84|nr:imidazole glycerol phosphate synthase subunit HisH [uncultured Treponema sp.]
MTGIIDYGLGNLGSIYNMLDVIGEDSIISDNPQKLHECDRLILPGVGSFDAGMKNLEEKSLINCLKKEVSEGKSILGICLGMQLLGRKSEEGSSLGLGFIPFDTVKFSFDKTLKLKIPHMGWDIVTFTQENKLLSEIDGRQRYYFVHSYHAKCDSERNVLMRCEYGYEFAASVVNENVYGVQFHPEKSHDFGMRLLKNFVEKC